MRNRVNHRRGVQRAGPLNIAAAVECVRSRAATESAPRSGSASGSTAEAWSSLVVAGEFTFRVGEQRGGRGGHRLGQFEEPIELHAAGAQLDSGDRRP